MRSYVNDTIYNALPSELKEKIIDTNVVSGHGSASGETNFTTTDKLYLLSAPEIFIGGYFDDTASDKTRQLDYYNNMVTTTSNGNGAAKNYNGSASWWWIRNPYPNFSSNFNVVDNYGCNSNDLATSTYGVAVAFRIG